MPPGERMPLHVGTIVPSGFTRTHQPRNGTLLRAKVTKLQQSFITSVQTLDYVDVNAQRGVNIFAKEPGLSDATRQPPATTETPAAKPNDGKPDPQTPPPAAHRAPRVGA